MFCEREFAAYLGVKHVVAVDSGTDALQMALEVCGVEGVEYVAPANTFFTMVGAVSSCRGRLRLTDVEVRTFNMDSNHLSKTTSETTKAIVPVHLFGQAADIEAIQEVGVRHSRLIVENATQAYGATYDGRRLCNTGHLMFWLLPSKKSRCLR